MKIKSADALAKALKKIRAGKGRKKPRLVFTNGCFDILHVGHVSYLKKAKSLGDLLVVAVDDDESVRSLKGEGRPLNSVGDRMQVLAALECVDFVTPFGGSNPVPTIIKLRPDVLVKGGDWKPKQILGYAEVQSWKGKVRSLPYVSGKSTTGIIEKAKKSKK